jgi:hypothetical protein
MPELSRFFGIIIRMYAEANVSHHSPHFHAYYQEQVAIYAIDPRGTDCRSIAETSTALGRSVGRAAPSGTPNGLATAPSRPQTASD